VRVKTTIVLDEDLWLRFKVACWRRRMRLHAGLEQAISRWLEEVGEGEREV